MIIITKHHRYAHVLIIIILQRNEDDVCCHTPKVELRASPVAILTTASPEPSPRPSLVNKLWFIGKLKFGLNCASIAALSPHSS